MLRFASALLLLALSFRGATRLEQALDLEAKGKLRESQELLRSIIDDSPGSPDHRTLARALSVSGRISVSLGDYPAAIREESAASTAHRELKDDTALSEDLNTLGLANLYLGNYDQALADYEKALDLDRVHHDADGVVARENNIGNVYYFHGRYLDALRTYQQALDTINQAAPGQPWISWRRQLTIANLAALYQRLGKEPAALELYQQLSGTPQAMPKSEYAQLLLNEGVLYRRMGDPVKALEKYRASQALLATARHRDGEIGALRNIGIVRALDFNDLPGALEAFTAALGLARQSSDTRGIVQAALYRGEVLRRSQHLQEAENDFRTALEGADRAGLAEERWKALYGLGKVSEVRSRIEEASDFYRKAIQGIESVRAGLRLTSLRSEFLADKRDVYDSLIALGLGQSPQPIEEIFTWMEESRARTFQDRSRSTIVASGQSLLDVEAGLPPETLLLDVWDGSQSAAMLWITHSGAGILTLDLAAAPLQDEISALNRSVQSDGDGWREQSRSLGARLLKGLPAVKHLIVSPDGPLSTLPFELLTDPASGQLLIEKSDVSYVPAARFVMQRSAGRKSWRPPWRTQLLAFGDPPVSNADSLASTELWQPIPAAADEISEIARILPGRSEIHLGAGARKRDLFARPLAGVSLLHFSTHAVVDTENPDRSRILMAPDSASAPFDYIFQQEVYGLDLRGVDLVTVSACDTARGKTIRGDGVQAFSRAFLAAGAAASITSLWRVADRPTADFMKQLYYFLAQGQSKSEALRSAKIQFLRSGSALHEPRYWAAFVLNGDGWNPCVRVIPWGCILAGCGAVLLLLGWLFRRLRGRSWGLSTVASAPR